MAVMSVSERRASREVDAAAAPRLALRRKLRWLITGRAAVLTVLLGSGMAMTIASPGTLPIDTRTLSVLMVVTYTLTLAYAVLLERTAPSPWVTHLQLAIDAVVVSSVVYLTGGIN